MKRHYLLDDELLPQTSTEATNPLEIIGQYLEAFPLVIFTLGIYLQYEGIPYWRPVILIGGTLSILLYTIFSFILFRLGKYNSAELSLSILAVILFPLGISEAFLKNYTLQFPVLEYCLYACGAMLFLSSCLLIIKHSNKNSSNFYRSLIARLMMISIILIIFNY